MNDLSSIWGEPKYNGDIGYRGRRTDAVVQRPVAIDENGMENISDFWDATRSQPEKTTPLSPLFKSPFNEDMASTRSTPKSNTDLSFDTNKSSEVYSPPETNTFDDDIPFHMNDINFEDNNDNKQNINRLPRYIDSESEINDGMTPAIKIAHKIRNIRPTPPSTPKKDSFSDSEKSSESETISPNVQMETPSPKEKLETPLSTPRADGKKKEQNASIDVEGSPKHYSPFKSSRNNVYFSPNSVFSRLKNNEFENFFENDDESSTKYDKNEIKFVNQKRKSRLPTTVEIGDIYQPTIQNAVKVKVSPNQKSSFKFNRKKNDFDFQKRSEKFLSDIEQPYQTGHFNVKDRKSRLEDGNDFSNSFLNPISLDMNETVPPKTNIFKEIAKPKYNKEILNNSGNKDFENLINSKYQEFNFSNRNNLLEQNLNEYNPTQIHIPNQNDFEPKKIYSKRGKNYQDINKSSRNKRDFADFSDYPILNLSKKENKKSSERMERTFIDNDKENFASFNSSKHNITQVDFLNENKKDDKSNKYFSENSSRISRNSFVQDNDDTSDLEIGENVTQISEDETLKTNQKNTGSYPSKRISRSIFNQEENDDISEPKQIFINNNEVKKSERENLEQNEENNDLYRQKRNYMSSSIQDNNNDTSDLEIEENISHVSDNENSKTSSKNNVLYHSKRKLRTSFNSEENNAFSNSKQIFLNTDEHEKYNISDDKHNNKNTVSYKSKKDSRNPFIQDNNNSDNSDSEQSYFSENETNTNNPNENIEVSEYIYDNNNYEKLSNMENTEQNENNTVPSPSNDIKRNKEAKSVSKESFSEIKGAEEKQNNSLFSRISKILDTNHTKSIITKTIKDMNISSASDIEEIDKDQNSNNEEINEQENETDSNKNSTKGKQTNSTINKNLSKFEHQNMYKKTIKKWFPDEISSESETEKSPKTEIINSPKNVEDEGKEDVLSFPNNKNEDFENELYLEEPPLPDVPFSNVNNSSDDELPRPFISDNSDNQPQLPDSEFSETEISIPPTLNNPFHVYETPSRNSTPSKNNSTAISKNTTPSKNDNSPSNNNTPSKKNTDSTKNDAPSNGESKNEANEKKKQSRTKPKIKRDLKDIYVTLSDDDDLPIALRKKKRPHTRRLKYWLGEKILYQPDENGFLTKSGVLEVKEESSSKVSKKYNHKKVTNSSFEVIPNRIEPSIEETKSIELYKGIENGVITSNEIFIKEKEQMEFFAEKEKIVLHVFSGKAKLKSKGKEWEISTGGTIYINKGDKCSIINKSKKKPFCLFRVKI